MNKHRIRLGLELGKGLILLAAVLYLGCATSPTYQPSIAGIKKVLLVGFPGQVYDQRNKKRLVLNLAETNLAYASDFDIQVDGRDLRELHLLLWGREGEPCLTFKMFETDSSATVNLEAVTVLAREKKVDAIMIGGLRLYPEGGGKPRLVLDSRGFNRKTMDILEDAETDVFLEAILVGADGSCRWHGRKETSLNVGTGLKSFISMGLSYKDEVAYNRIERGLKYLFLNLPKPPKTD